MKKFYEKAELDIKDLRIFDLTNSETTSPPDFFDDESKTDDGSWEVG